MKIGAVGLVTVLALGLLAAPLAADAQQTRKSPRMGFLGVRSLSETSPQLDALRQGLRQLGWVEGQNIDIEYRFAEGRRERLPDLAAELVRLKVDVIVAVAAPAIRAARTATQTIPIVFALAADPVASGLVASLARPGGNLTGLTLLAPELSGKRLELLKEAIAAPARVGVLWNPANPDAAATVKETEAAARALGLQLLVVGARGPAEIEGAFSAMIKERAGALVVIPDPMLLGQRARIVELSAKNRLAAMYYTRDYAEAGGLMSYGASLPDSFRRAATYVDKILKGAKPDDLPVEQPTKFELVVNLKTAKALGLTIPQSVLLRADEVIK